MIGKYKAKYSCLESCEKGTTTNKSGRLTIKRPHKEVGKCTEANTRIRKDVRKLTKQERERLEQAMQDIVDDGIFAEVGNYHGLPLWFCNPLKKYTKGINVRGAPYYGYSGCSPYADPVKFLFWHRYLILKLEQVIIRKF